MAKGPVKMQKERAMGKTAKTGAPKGFKKGGEVKGKEVKVKHVAMKKGGKC